MHMYPHAYGFHVAAVNTLTQDEQRSRQEEKLFQEREVCGSCRVRTLGIFSQRDCGCVFLAQ